MCICKENYSFYKNLSVCISNEILENGYYYRDRLDDVSLIPIYEDKDEYLLNTIQTEELNILNTNAEELNNLNTISSEELISDICLNEKNIWFQIGEYTFYYAIINNCNYIFYNNSLFFYSNKSDCSFHNNSDYSYISKCLNNSELINEEKYTIFLNNSKEYNPKDEFISIYKKIDNFYFYLINMQKNSSLSEVEISDSCEKKLKLDYHIENNTKLLMFIVDIKRYDTISKQVEYKFYNPNPRKIFESLNLNHCLSPEIRKLNKNSLNINEANILTPLELTDNQKDYIEELYEKNIFLFNPNDDFYNDVCFKYKIPKKNVDIYIQNRRKKYFINLPLCQSDCIINDYNISYITNYKVKCHCPLKMEPKMPDTIFFIKKNIDEFFNKKVLAPNIEILKCGKVFINNIFNFGFCLTCIFLIIFIISYLVRIYCDSGFHKNLRTFSESIDCDIRINEEDSEIQNRNEIKERESQKDNNEEIENYSEELNKRDNDEKIIKFNSEKTSNNGKSLISSDHVNFHKSNIIKGNFQDLINESNSNNFNTSKIEKDENKPDDDKGPEKEEKKTNSEKKDNKKKLVKSNNFLNDTDIKKKMKNNFRQKKQANPPKKKVISKILDKNKINNSILIKIKKPQEQELNKNENGINSERYQLYNSIENESTFDFSIYKDEDKKGFWKIFNSMIKHNSTIIFIFCEKNNDFFARSAIAILSFNLYLLLNLLLMFNSSSLHLYKDRDYDLNEKFEIKYFIINVILTFFLCIPIISFLKKLTSIKEFIFYKNYEYDKIVDCKNLKREEKVIKLHDIKIQISKFKNKMEKWAK